MTVLVMDVLPDCNVCFGPVHADVEDDTLRPIEVCSVCDLRQPQMASFLGIPLAVRVVVELARAGGLVAPLCRACDRGDHGRCWQVRCTCTCEVTS